jgi:hypothetical protein
MGIARYGYPHFLPSANRHSGVVYDLSKLPDLMKIIGVR